MWHGGVVIYLYICAKQTYHAIASLLRNIYHVNQPHHSYIYKYIDLNPLDSLHRYKYIYIYMKYGFLSRDTRPKSITWYKITLISILRSLEYIYIYIYIVWSLYQISIIWYIYIYIYIYMWLGTVSMIRILVSPDMSLSSPHHDHDDNPLDWNEIAADLKYLKWLDDRPLNMALQHSNTCTHDEISIYIYIYLSISI